jgi:putative membrane protein
MQYTPIVLAHAGPWAENGDPGGWWWLWRLGMLLFWIVLVGTAIWFFRRSGWRRQPNGLERARDILAERYARGEISGEEYRERLGELG